MGRGGGQLRPLAYRREILSPPRHHERARSQAGYEKVLAPEPLNPRESGTGQRVATALSRRLGCDSKKWNAPDCQPRLPRKLGTLDRPAGLLIRPWDRIQFVAGRSCSPPPRMICLA